MTCKSECDSESKSESTHECKCDGCHALDGYTEYRKKGTQLMRPYVVDESMEGISVTLGVQPTEGGMIAIARDDTTDMWYVAKNFFSNNYEPVS